MVYERTGKLRDLNVDCEKIEQQQQNVIVVKTFIQFAFATKNCEILKIRNNNRQKFGKIS